MNTQKKLFLLPYRFQTIGGIIAVIGFLVCIVPQFFGLDGDASMHCILYGMLAVALGLFMFGFSKERQEDEFTLYLRTSSALRALLIVFALQFVLKLIVSILEYKQVFGEFGMKTLNEFVDSITSLGAVFILYLIMYKVRLRRYNRMAIDTQEEEAYEE